MRPAADGLLARRSRRASAFPGLTTLCVMEDHSPVTVARTAPDTHRQTVSCNVPATLPGVCVMVNESLGMMAGLPRTNCWSLAEHAGAACPRGMQRLLSAARWDADAVLGDVRGWVVEHLGDLCD